MTLRAPPQAADTWRAQIANKGATCWPCSHRVLGRRSAAETPRKPPCAPGPTPTLQQSNGTAGLIAFHTAPPPGPNAPAVILPCISQTCLWPPDRCPAVPPAVQPPGHSALLLTNSHSPGPSAHLLAAQAPGVTGASLVPSKVTSVDEPPPPAEATCFALLAGPSHKAIWHCV